MRATTSAIGLDTLRLKTSLSFAKSFVLAFILGMQSDLGLLLSHFFLKKLKPKKLNCPFLVRYIYFVFPSFTSTSSFFSSAARMNNKRGYPVFILYYGLATCSPC